jgi:single stranded DNA-binding protein
MKQSHAGATFIGRLAADPVDKGLSQEGNRVVTYSIAVNPRYKRKDEGDKPDYFDIVVVGKKADIDLQYLRKGRLVFIECTPRTKTWEKNGYKRKTIEFLASNVVYLDKEKVKSFGIDDDEE